MPRPRRAHPLSSMRGLEWPSATTRFTCLRLLPDTSDTERKPLDLLAQTHALYACQS
jgi:hypothetical protein